MKAGRTFTTALAAMTMLLGVLGTQPGAAAAPAASPAWRVVSSPDQSHAKTEVLNGVSCSSAADCMAVGDYSVGSAGTALLFEHWNGARWSILPAPSIGLPAVLEHVSCSSKASCIAVGYFIAGGEDQPLATRWNGHAWSQLNFPDAPGIVEGQLTGIDCFSRTDCVAVGWTFNNSTDAAVIARFNGASWTMGKVDSWPKIWAPRLLGMSCSTGTWCVAVGDAVIEPSGRNTAITLTSANQTTWTYARTLRLPAADSGFYGVSCTGTKTCVAFGWGNPVLNKSYQWVIQSGSGNTWRESLIPQRTTLPVALPNDIACVSGQQCVIVGGLAYGFAVTSKYTSLIMTWNSRNLSILPSLTLHGFPDSYLDGVTCKTGACWAVGGMATEKISRSLVERS